MFTDKNILSKTFGVKYSFDVIRKDEQPGSVLSIYEVVLNCMYSCADDAKEFYDFVHLLMCHSYKNYIDFKYKTMNCLQGYITRVSYDKVSTVSIEMNVFDHLIIDAIETNKNILVSFNDKINVESSILFYTCTVFGCIHFE